MKVYTKTGDEGTTSKYDGKRVPKDDQLIIIGGKVDNLLAALDSALVVVKNKEILFIIEDIQKKLWQTAGEISLGGKGKNVKDCIEEQHITEFEKLIDKYNQKISFFMRFTTESSTRLNEARVRCRDLEIAITPLFRENKLRSEIYKYINRLSDLLFVLACYFEKN